MSPSIVYFALQNGGRRPTSFTADHRNQLTTLVRESLEGCPRLRVHAFSWTSSEIRIALEADAELLRAFVRKMAVLHRRRMHSEICRSECLFDRGYGGRPVEGDRELLTVVEHIHNAPVRAGLARRPADYVWSSCRAYMGLEQVAWLTTDVVAGLLEESQANAPKTARQSLNASAGAARRPT